MEPVSNNVIKGFASVAAIVSVVKVTPVAVSVSPVGGVISSPSTLKLLNTLSYIENSNL